MASFNKIPLTDFNYDLTLLGGQSFSWDKLSDNKTYLGTTDTNAIVIRPTKDTLYWQTYPKQNDLSFIKEYFQIKKDYMKIIETIKQDPIIAKAIKTHPNIRVLKQPFNYTVLTFIISANNNIKSIRRSVRKLSKLFGEKINIPGIGKVNLFPTAKKIASLSIKDLQKTSVGFRAKYLKETAKLLTEKRLSERYLQMNETKLREELLKLHGVGDKIADCVLAFAAGFENVTPMDVWGKRILVDLYGLSGNLKYQEYREFTKQQFGGYALYAGQFLFEWYRKNTLH